jgi:hypothetical protein
MRGKSDRLTYQANDVAFSARPPKLELLRPLWGRGIEATTHHISDWTGGHAHWIRDMNSNLFWVLDPRMVTRAVGHELIYQLDV